MAAIILSTDKCRLEATEQVHETWLRWRGGDSGKNNDSLRSFLHIRCFG